MNFKDLKINTKLVDELKKNGITTPTKVQVNVIPEIINKNDVIGKSKTGSGKTLAFLLPILQKIDSNSKNTEVLILSPTRELAIQITEEANKFNINDDIDKIISTWHNMAFYHYSNTIKLKEVVIPYLDSLKKEGIKIALATSNSVELLEATLKNNNIYQYYSCLS